MLPVLLAATSLLAEPYEASWESLDQRPNPQWFEDAKFGIFIHWGVYSVPSWGRVGSYSEWYWHDMQPEDAPTRRFHNRVYGEEFTYPEFGPEFRAELFDPRAWARTFERSGAQYVVLTSKHHDGYCLWPSAEAWNWNSAEVGPKRDLCGELIRAVRLRGLRMGFYYSLYEWFNPLYLSDVDRYVDEHMLPQLKDLVTRYEPDIIWPDGEWQHPSDTWRSEEFLAWLLNDSPAPDDVVFNDRWGKETRNVHGGYATPEYGGAPEGRLIAAGLFEENQGMGRSFGYNRNESAAEYRSTRELLHLLIDNVSRGGNLLLDIGPAGDGRIPEIMEERLLEMGDWLEVNGEAIYGTDRLENAPVIDGVRFTQNDGSVYAICVAWPGATLELPVSILPNATGAAMLGLEEALVLERSGDTYRIEVPALTPDVIPCDHAWVVQLSK